MRFHELAWTHDPQYKPTDIFESDINHSLDISSNSSESHKFDASHKPFKQHIDNKNPIHIGKPFDVYIPSKSLYVMRDDLRYGWQHEIQKNRIDRPSCFRRVSLVFRSSP